MKIYRLLLAFVATFGVLGAQAQTERPLTKEQNIESYRLEVTFNKTVHLIFPSGVKYVDLGSPDIIAGKADGVENVVRVKAAVEGFDLETNFSVITTDGTFYAFNVVYADEPQRLNINIDQWRAGTLPPEGPAGGVLLSGLGEEDPAIIRSVMYTIYKQDRRDVKHIGCREFGMQALLKGIYTHKDLLFMHISLANFSNIPFDVDFIRFRIVDKKVVKRTAQQETLIQPVRTFSSLTRIEGQSAGHMVYAFGKVTIPDDKMLEVETYERNGSRHQRFRIENSDLVDAKLVKQLKRR